MRVQGFVFFVYDALKSSWSVLRRPDGSPVFSQEPDPPTWAKAQYMTIRPRAVTFELPDEQPKKVLVFFRSYPAILASIVFLPEQEPRHYYIWLYRGKPGEPKRPSIIDFHAWVEGILEVVAPGGPSARNVAAGLIGDDGTEAPIGDEAGLSRFIEQLMTQQGHLLWGI